MTTQTQFRLLAPAIALVLQLAGGIAANAQMQLAANQTSTSSVKTDRATIAGAAADVPPSTASGTSLASVYRARKVASPAKYKATSTAATAPVTVHCLPALSRQGSGVALALDGSKYSIESDDHVLLAVGAMLFATQRPLKISCLSGAVYLSRRSIVLVEADKDTLRVIDFSDQRKDGIKVVLGRLLVPLRPGVKVFVTPGKPSIADIFDIPEVGQRSITVTEVPGLGFVTTSEVSLKDELGAEPMLAAIRTQGRAALDPKLVKDITKMAAILNLVLRSREPFQKVKPEVLLAAVRKTQTGSSSNDIGAERR